MSWAVVWRLKVKHTTRYRYQGMVTASYNEARMTPLSVPGQTTIDARFDVRPAARTFRYWDYWGTQVHAFDLHLPHDQLVVTASAVVETSDPQEIAEPVSWEVLGRDDMLDQWCELLRPSTYVPADPVLAEEATRLAGPGGSGGDPQAVARAANAFVHERLHYLPGATTVATSAPEAFAKGAGVCQDFAHILLGILRPAGIPARYVSGYLYPGAGDEAGAGSTPPAGFSEPRIGESHAWVEAWVGDWLPLDPTHGGLSGPQHVIVARGRDYADVTPLKGIFSGAAVEELSVNVELSRLA